MTLDSILTINKEKWEEPYHSPNVDHCVFRFYGRILRSDFGMPLAEPRTTLLDFGCGQASSVLYFHNLGFDAYGLDASNTNIAIAQERNPNIAQNLGPIPYDTNSIESFTPFFGRSKFDVIISIQTLYYLPKVHFYHALDLIYNALPEGGIFYATMISVHEEVYYGNSTLLADGDGWMRKVQISFGRFDDKKSAAHKETVMHFVQDREDLIKKFDRFKPLHIGEYMGRFHSDDGSGHHYTFCGIKE